MAAALGPLPLRVIMEKGAEAAEALNVTEIFYNRVEDHIRNQPDAARSHAFDKQRMDELIQALDGWEDLDAQERSRRNKEIGNKHLGTCLPAVARALAVPAGCVQASSAGGLSLAEQTGSFWPARSCRADFASPHSTKSNTPPCRAMASHVLYVWVNREGAQRGDPSNRCPGRG